MWKEKIKTNIKTINKQLNLNVFEGNRKLDWNDLKD